MSLVKKYEQMIELILHGEECKKIKEKIVFCIKNPQDYYDRNEDRFAERGLEYEMSEEDEIDEDMLTVEEMAWIGLVDELEESRNAFEFDFKVELEEFIWGMEQIKLFDKSLLENVELNEDESIIEWTEILDKALAKDNMTLIGFDIDSDSYVISLCEKEKYSKLCSFAEAIGQRIDHPYEM
ncbi:MAG: DUF6630 family protein [Lachnospiraceae bacterium]